jgi:hypothetical protein
LNTGGHATPEKRLTPPPHLKPTFSLQCPQSAHRTGNAVRRLRVSQSPISNKPRWVLFHETGGK